MGAALGSKVLYWFEEPLITLRHLGDPAFLFGGKTIVGALIGALLAVEAAKKYMGVSRRTAIPRSFMTAAALEKVLPFRGRGETHMVATVWVLLAFGLGFLIFRYRTARHRQASFSAGLVTAVALFLLLFSACWNFSMG